MDKFNLFNFISKLMSDKDAQNSLTNIIGKLFTNGANSNAPSKENLSATTTKYYDESSDVYRSPSSYSLYSDMIKRHDEIAKNITPSNKT